MSSASVPTGDDLTVICEPSGEHLILHVFGELDLATAPALERQLENAWANDPPALVLDLRGMTFIDSTGVKLILETHLRAITQEKRFSLRRLPRQAQRVFDLLGLTGRLPIDD
jgi:anti-sigma B factor antagonist